MKIPPSSFSVIFKRRFLLTIDKRQGEMAKKNSRHRLFSVLFESRDVEILISPRLTTWKVRLTSYLSRVPFLCRSCITLFTSEFDIEFFLGIFCFSLFSREKPCQKVYRAKILSLLRRSIINYSLKVIFSRASEVWLIFLLFAFLLWPPFQLFLCHDESITFQIFW